MTPEGLIYPICSISPIISPQGVQMNHMCTDSTVRSYWGLGVPSRSQSSGHLPRVIGSSHTGDSLSPEFWKAS